MVLTHATNNPVLSPVVCQLVQALASRERIPFWHWQSSNYDHTYMLAIVQSIRNEERIHMLSLINNLFYDHVMASMDFESESVMEG